MLDKSHFVYYPQEFESNVMHLKDSFSCIKKFIPAYSFKTNFNEDVLETALKCGLHAEVVSPYEYDLAIKCGFPKNRIIYNGVIKSRAQIIDLSTNGGLVNLDNREDFEVVKEYFEKNGKTLSVGVRLNFDVGNKIKSRFGIEIDSPLFKEIVGCEKNGVLEIKALSCHFTQTCEDIYWQKKIEKLIECSTCFKKIEFLDLGGSLAARNEKRDSRNVGRGKIDWASISAAVSAQIIKSGMENISVILECGTALVSSAFEVTANVIHIKENGFVILDVSFMDLLLPSSKDNAQFEVIECSCTRRFLNNYCLSGYTCLENDIIKKGFNGMLGVGDKIVFKNMGAYTLSMSNSFISPVLPVVVM